MELRELDSVDVGPTVYLDEARRRSALNVQVGTFRIETNLVAHERSDQAIAEWTLASGFRR